MADAYSSSSRGQVESKGPGVDASALIMVAIVVAGLYLGRDVLVPLVVAVLLSFVLAIPVRKLQALGLGRTFPVALVVVLAFCALTALAAVITSQLTDLATDLPRYQSTIRDKVTALKSTTSGHGPLERLVGMLQGLSDEVSGKDGPAAAPVKPGDATPDRPLPVEITMPRSSAIGMISGYVAPVLHPLATAGLVAVFTIFMLLQRGDLRNRAIRLAGSHDLQRTTAAMNDAAKRLSRFFLVQVLLNSGFGLLVGIGLWAIGVPSPTLWGILAAISRFVPYVGVVIAAGGPLILAAAVDPHWTMFAFTAAFFAASELLLGQVIEPLVYGHSTGLSPVAVIVSVTFWTWLWGPIGLILATPLTVCLVVIGRHVDRLEFLEVMLGDRPPLTVVESFYQRILAGDAGEAIEQADDFLKAHSVLTFYDDIAVRALGLAQADLARGALDEARLGRISDTVGQLVEDLAEREGDPTAQDARKADTKRAAGDADLDAALDESDARARDLPTLDRASLPAGWNGEAAVLCIAGRNELDRAAAAMLVQVLGRHGLGARAESAEVLTSAGVVRLFDPSVQTVCLCYLDTSSPAHVRYATRRIRRRLPNARIVVGAWGISEGDAKALCEAARSDGCAGRLIEAARLCLDGALAAGALPAGSAPANSVPESILAPDMTAEVVAVA